jgi:subtilisin family serine protease
MKKAPKTIDHPSFGRCELVPNIFAIKLVSALQREELEKFTSDFSLSPATERAAQTQKGENRETSRDPAAPVVNQSANLVWVSKPQPPQLDRLSEDARVDWVSPVYRAKSAEGGPRSYFAVNPKVLILSGKGASLVPNLSELGTEVTIDEPRTALMKGFVVLKLPKGDALDVLARVKASPALKDLPSAVKLENIPYIKPTAACGCGAVQQHSQSRGKCSPSTTPHIPNDPFFTSQWGLQRVGAENVWPVTRGEPNVIIAVLDEGVELNHPDLDLYPVSYSTITHTNDGSPVGNHGTACAGIIGARMDNNLGLAGLANRCKVMAIATNFADTEVAEGLFFAADNGARVVSMSFGVYPSWMVWDFSLIEAALQYAHEKNLVLVAASGNENQPISRFPGSDPRTLCVGGSNRDDVRKRIGDTSSESWWGACYGPDVEVVAPCLEIPTTDRLGIAGYTPNDYDMFFNGTSSATPHVAALAGLVLSVNPNLTNTEARQIICESTEKINPAGYVYLPAPGKPYGVWNAEVGYGRINAERAVLVACSRAAKCAASGPCAVELCEPDECCVSPCDPPWRTDEQCIFWYEDKFFRVPLSERDIALPPAGMAVLNNYLEFRITYEHKLCLLGKQHGPLLFTTTLLPGETVKLYHSERYRRITTAQQRYSVQTTFMQFFSTIHQAKVTNSVEVLNELLTNGKASGSSSSGGGLFLGLFSVGGSSSGSFSSSVSSSSLLSVQSASELFSQSVFQASQLTHAERSLMISTYEETDVKDVTARILHNANECRAVTYFVRQVVELYAISTRVSSISYRIIAGNLPPDWHAINDIGWLPPWIQKQITQILALLPKVGQVVVQPRHVSVPTDGVVYDPELAHCCSCEPERAAAIAIRLETQKAAALKLCLEAEALKLELQRRQMLLQKGDLNPFERVAQLNQMEAPR